MQVLEGVPELMWELRQKYKVATQGPTPTVTPHLYVAARHDKDHRRITHQDRKTATSVCLREFCLDEPCIRRPSFFV
jgi:hypothetical protein